jgi:hypothetical protein
MSARIVQWAAMTEEDGFALPPPLAKAMRRTDAFSRYAVLAAMAAWAKLPRRELPPQVTGIILATCHGPMETGFRFLDSIEDNEPSPIRFTHSVHNVAAGYIAWALQLTGPVLTLTTFHWPLVAALDQALLDLESGRIQRALVLAVEMNSPFLESARMPPAGDDSATGDPGSGGATPRITQRATSGAVAWILESATGPGLWLQEVTQTPRSCAVNALLLRSGEEWTGPGLAPDGRAGIPTGSGYPQDHALALTRGLDTLPNTGEPIQWRLVAPFGEAGLTLRADPPRLE